MVVPSAVGRTPPLPVGISPPRGGENWEPSGLSLFKGGNWGADRHLAVRGGEKWEEGGRRSDDEGDDDGEEGEHDGEGDAEEPALFAAEAVFSEGDSVVEGVELAL